MAVAFSNDTIEVADVTASSSANLRSGIHSVLSNAGWSFTTITGGYRYRATSPQGLLADLDVWDDGTYTGGAASGGGAVDYVKLQLRGTAAGTGRVHRLGFTGGRSYRMWANVCQFFVNINADYKTSWYQSLGLGIPQVPNPAAGSPCEQAAASGAVSECWWSLGSGWWEESNLNIWNNFRNCALTRDPWVGSNAADFSACLNGTIVNRDDLVGAPGYGPPFGIRLLPLALAQHNERTDPPLLRAYPAGETDFAVWAPLIAWGSKTGTAHNSWLTVAGQLWDAVLISDFQSIDAELTLDSIMPVRCYTYGDPTILLEKRRVYSSTLALISEVPASGRRNYAY